MQKQFNWQASTISYRITGEGKTVVLLHGFGEDSHIWDAQLPVLGEHCRLIIPDLPGSGASLILHREKPGTVTIDDYADCIHALLQYENIHSCILLGHSMGGYITLAFAEKYPQLLTGFGLVHATAAADSEEKKATREKGISFIQQHGAYTFLKTSIPNLFGAAFKASHPEKIAVLVAGAAQFTNEALEQYYRAMILRPDRRPVLKSNPLPVLFVMGTEDVAAPLDEVLQQTHLPVKSYIHVLHGTGHMSMLEAPEQLARFMLDFIKA